MYVYAHHSLIVNVGDGFRLGLPHQMSVHLSESLWSMKAEITYFVCVYKYIYVFIYIYIYISYTYIH